MPRFKHVKTNAIVDVPADQKSRADLLRTSGKYIEISGKAGKVAAEEPGTGQPPVGAVSPEPVAIEPNATISIVDGKLSANVAEDAEFVILDVDDWNDVLDHIDSLANAAGVNPIELEVVTEAPAEEPEPVKEEKPAKKGAGDK